MDPFIHVSMDGSIPLSHSQQCRVGRRGSLVNNAPIMLYPPPQVRAIVGQGLIYQVMQVMMCVGSLYLSCFFDDWAMERTHSCTLAYAESKKFEKKKRYNFFTRRSLTKEELMAFIGVLILLGINYL